MTTRNYFGLHIVDGLTYLHQQDGSVCVTPGLEDFESPIKVDVSRWYSCPHQFVLPTDEDEGPVFNHPFVRAMSPAYQTGEAYYIKPKDTHWLYKLSKMVPSSGPTTSVMPWWAKPPTGERWAAAQLVLTNLAPLVLTDFTVRDRMSMERLASTPRLRNLLMAGAMTVPGLKELSSDGLPEDFDWVAEGRRQLYQHIRRNL